MQFNLFSLFFAKQLKVVWKISEGFHGFRNNAFWRTAADEEERRNSA